MADQVQLVGKEPVGVLIGIEPDLGRALGYPAVLPPGVEAHAVDGGVERHPVFGAGLSVEVAGVLGNFEDDPAEPVGLDQIADLVGGTRMGDVWPMLRLHSPKLRAVGRVAGGVAVFFQTVHSPCLAPLGNIFVT